MPRLSVQIGVQMRVFTSPRAATPTAPATTNRTLGIGFRMAATIWSSTRGPFAAPLCLPPLPLLRCPLLGSSHAPAGGLYCVGAAISSRISDSIQSRPITIRVPLLSRVPDEDEEMDLSPRLSPMVLTMVPCDRWALGRTGGIRVGWYSQQGAPSLRSLMLQGYRNAQRRFIYN